MTKLVPITEPQNCFYRDTSEFWAACGPVLCHYPDNEGGLCPSEVEFPKQCPLADAEVTLNHPKGVE